MDTQPETYVAGTGTDYAGTTQAFIAWVDGKGWTHGLVGFGATPLAAIVDLLDAEDNAAQRA